MVQSAGKQGFGARFPSRRKCFVHLCLVCGPCETLPSIPPLLIFGRALDLTSYFTTFSHPTAWARYPIAMWHFSVIILTYCVIISC